VNIFLKLFLAFFLFGVLPFSGGMILLLLSYEGILRGLLAESYIQEVLPQIGIEVQLQLENARLQALFIFLLLLLLTGFAALLVGRAFSAPIQEILRAVKRIAAGDYTTKVAQRANDEFGDVSVYFNRMIMSLKEAKEREAAIGKMKSEFISIAAHQLRTPLSAIKWTFRMILDRDVGDITPEQREFLEKGYASNERMIRLVSDLLDVSRIEEGRFGYQFRKIDLGELIKQVVDEFTLLAQERGLEVQLQLPERGTPPLIADPDRLRLAISNLFANAINYTLPGGKVTISVTLRKDAVAVSVADTGVGIPKAQVENLFTKFFRADNVIRMQTEGSGLGLFIVRNIVRRHGGDITVESEEGKGSTFTFALPLEAAQIPAQEIYSSE